MGNEPDIFNKLGEQIYCSLCKGKRNHLILLTHKTISNEYDDYWSVYYHIVCCAGCENISFVEEHQNDETDKMIDGQMIRCSEFIVFPEEPKTRDSDELFSLVNEIEVKSFHYAPKSLKKLYIQIAEAFNNQHYILATFGLRVLIEGICSELKIKKGFLYENDRTKKLDDDGKEIKTDSLGGRIFGLYEGGHILFPNALILLEIKKVGNNALHEIEIPHFVVIYQMIIILEKIMDDVYELNNHYFIAKNESGTK